MVHKVVSFIFILAQINIYSLCIILYTASLLMKKAIPRKET